MNRSGFSLIELVIVTVIIGVIGAIAVPRLSRGADGASESAAIHNEQALQEAIERYRAEHYGDAPDADDIAAQLTGYTDANGNTSEVNTAPYIFGPYLRTIPPQQAGARRGKSDISAVDSVTTGWIYTESTGTVRGNIIN